MNIVEAQEEFNRKTYCLSPLDFTPSYRVCLQRWHLRNLLRRSLCFRTDKNVEKQKCHSHFLLSLTNTDSGTFTLQETDKGNGTELIWKRAEEIVQEVNRTARSRANVCPGRNTRCNHLFGAFSRRVGKLLPLHVVLKYCYCRYSDCIRHTIKKNWTKRCYKIAVEIEIGGLRGINCVFSLSVCTTQCGHCLISKVRIESVRVLFDKWLTFSFFFFLLFLIPKRLQLLLLNPLKELSNVFHADIRQKQLESVLQILQSQGDGLGPGWPLVLGVIGAIRNDQGWEEKRWTEQAGLYLFSCRCNSVL